MKSFPYFFSVLVFLLIIGITGCNQIEENRPPNVLFIAIDDLRPQLACYGESYMYTPNLDRLAAKGRLFRQHYVQVPTCGASRNALLMGQYPNTVQDISNYVIRDHLEEAKNKGFYTLPQLFKANAYYTACLGKISHHVDGRIFSYDGKGDGRLEMPDSWDMVWGPTAKWGSAWNAFFGYADGSNRNSKNKQVAPVEFLAEEDKDLPDGLIAKKAIEGLRQLKDQKQPFFLAVGFLKPHLPFVAPRKYWDLYDEVELPLSPNPEMPVNVAPMSVHNSGELFDSYLEQAEKGGAGIRLTDEYALYLRRAYFAAVSYTDAQLGRLMKVLEETGLDENTIVVVWGDHGWHLGDHTVWGKHTLFERSLRSALIIKTPNMPMPGVASDAIVETVDLYPSLLELCGLKARNPLSGKSLLPILADPGANLDQMALGFWNAGYTVRTPRYRFTRLKKGDQLYAELYDHQRDRNEAENLAGWKEYNSIADSLEKLLVQAVPQTYWESVP